MCAMAQHTCVSLQRARCGMPSIGPAPYVVEVAAAHVLRHEEQVICRSREASKHTQTHKYTHTPSRPKNELTTKTGPKTTKLGTATTSLNPRSRWGVRGAGRRAERLVLDYGQPVHEYWCGEAGGSAAESPRYSANARPRRVWVGVRPTGWSPHWPYRVHAVP